MFRFESYWIHHPVFLETVKRAWAIHVNSPNMAWNLCKKLKHLRHELKSWSKNISKLSIAIENTNRALLEIDGLENRRPLTTPEANFRTILKNHLLRLMSYQKLYWKKRCTVRWVQFGDENSKKIQAMASGFCASGFCAEDHASKEAIIFQTFKDRLGTKPSTTWNLTCPESSKRLMALMNS